MRGKKYLITLLVLILVLSTCAIVAYASNPIRIFMNGNVVESDVAPQIIDGRTMVPIRTVSEALGAEVSWDGHTRSVYISLDAADRNEYNNFVTEYNNKIVEDKNLVMAARSSGKNSEVYTILIKLSNKYDNLMNKAMLLHPPSDKAEEHNQRLKMLIHKKTAADLLIRSYEEMQKGNTEEANILMFEAAKYLT